MLRKYRLCYTKLQMKLHVQALHKTIQVMQCTIVCAPHYTYVCRSVKANRNGKRRISDHTSMDLLIQLATQHIHYMLYICYIHY